MIFCSFSTYTHVYLHGTVLIWRSLPDTPSPPKCTLWSVTCTARRSGFSQLRGLMSLMPKEMFNCWECWLVSRWFCLRRLLKWRRGSLLWMVNFSSCIWFIIFGWLLILYRYWFRHLLKFAKFILIKIQKYWSSQNPYWLNTKNHKFPLLFILESLTLIDLTCCFNLKFSNLFMHLHSLPCPCVWLCKCPSWWLCVVMLCCLPLLKLWSLLSGDLKYIFDFTTECCGFRTDSSIRARRLL